MNENTLSERLHLVASFLPKSAHFADIGSDHAYLPCFVCINDPSAQAIAGEINEGPFLSAKRTVDELELNERIEVRKGNGLEILHDGEVSELVIAGMGGGLITNILEQGKNKLSGVNRIIVQPNMDAHVIRKWFRENAYELVNEKIISEDGHIYEVLVADQGEGNSVYEEEYVSKQLLFGPFLLQEKSEPFKQKWNGEKQKRENALSQMTKAKQPDTVKIKKFQLEIQEIQEVLDNE